MNSYERLYRRMNGENIDQLPNMCLIMTFAAKQIGVPYGKYVSDYRLLSEGVWLCYEKFGIDALCVISDPMREAEGLGAKVIIPEDDVPYSPQPLITDISMISSLKAVDPSSSRRMNDRLEAIRILKDRAMGEVAVVGWVEGAVAESCDLMNMSEFMINLLDYPEEMQEMLERCTEQSILFAKEQIRAGAEIIGIGDAASSLIGPSLFEEFALPFQQKLIRAVHKEGAKVKLHICGDINPVLTLVAQTGADIIDLDHMVDMKKAAQLFPSTCSIAGNFDPISILFQGKPEFIEKTIINSTSEISLLNHNIVSAGCEIPKNTLVENVMSICRAIHKMRL